MIVQFDFEGCTVHRFLPTWDHADWRYLVAMIRTGDRMNALMWTVVSSSYRLFREVTIDLQLFLTRHEL